MKIDLKSKATILFASIVVGGCVGVIYFGNNETLRVFWAANIVALLILVVTQYSAKKTINELNVKLGRIENKIEGPKPNAELNERLEESIVENKRHWNYRKGFGIGLVIGIILVVIYFGFNKNDSVVFVIGTALNNAIIGTGISLPFLRLWKRFQIGYAKEGGFAGASVVLIIVDVILHEMPFAPPPSTGFAFVGFTMWSAPEAFAGKEALINWAAIGTLVALVVAPVKYFNDVRIREKERRQKEEDERSRISRNLYGELHDALKGLDETKHEKDLKKLQMKDKEDVYFMNRFLNHDIYDSLITSGKINFLTYELQQEVQDIFTRIKKHNYYLTLTSEIQDREKEITESAYAYYELIGNYEKELIKEIPDMMERLKKDFRFEPINN